MDVELPDGTVVEGVPDGMSQRDLVSLLSKNGHDTSWYKDPKPGVLDRIKSALTPDPDRAPMPSTSDTINEPWTNPKERGVVLPGSVMDGFVPPEADPNRGASSPNVGPMREEYYQATRAGLLSAPLQTHSAAAQAGGQVGKVARDTLSQRVDRAERIAAGDTLPKTQQEFTDDITGSAPLAFERAKERGRETLDLFKPQVIAEIQRTKQLSPEDAAAEFEAMRKYGVDPTDILQGRKEAGWGEVVSSVIGSTPGRTENWMANFSRMVFDSLGADSGSSAMARIAEETRKELEKQNASIGRIPAGSWKETFASALPSALDNLGGMTAAAVATIIARNPAILIGSMDTFVLAPMFMRKSGLSYEEGLKAGMQPNKAMIYGMAKGFSEVIPERLNFGMIAKAGEQAAKGIMRGAVANYMKANATEVAEEVITAVADHMIDLGMKDPNKSVEELWKDVKQSSLGVMMTMPLIMGGNAAAIGGYRFADAAGRKIKASRDLTYGMGYDPAAIDAAARRALDPSNAQMQQDILAAGSPAEAIAAFQKSLAPAIDETQLAIDALKAQAGTMSAVPTGFGQQSELADLIAQEKADLELRRGTIAEQQGAMQALRQESELESADARVEGARQEQSRQNRLQLLDAIYANPEERTPAMTFMSQLEAEFPNNPNPTPEEKQFMAQRESAYQAFKTEPVEPSLPNETDFGIKEAAPAEPAKPSVDRVRFAQRLLERPGNRLKGDVIRNKYGKVLLKLRPEEVSQVSPQSPVQTPIQSAVLPSAGAQPGQAAAAPIQPQGIQNEQAAEAIADIGAAMAPAVTEAIAATQSEIDALLADQIIEGAKATPNIEPTTPNITTVPIQGIPDAQSQEAVTPEARPQAPAAAVTDFIAQGENGRWALSRPIDNQPPETVAVIIAELDRLNAAQAAPSQEVAPPSTKAEPTPQPAKGTVRYYHGGSPEGVDGPLWFTSDRNDANGWASRSPGMGLWYVDIPEGDPIRGGDPEFGVIPPSRIELPPEIASKRTLLVDGKAEPAPAGAQPQDSIGAQLGQAMEDGRAKVGAGGTAPAAATKQKLNAFGLPMGVTFKGNEKVPVSALKAGDWIMPGGNAAKVMSVKDNGDGTFDLNIESQLSRTTSTFSGSVKVTRKVPAEPAPAGAQPTTGGQDGQRQETAEVLTEPAAAIPASAAAASQEAKLQEQYHAAATEANDPRLTDGERKLSEAKASAALDALGEATQSAPKNTEASRQNPETVSQSRKPSEPGADGVAPIQDKAAPSITRIKGGKLRITGYAEDDVTGSLPKAIADAVAITAADGEVSVAMKDGSKMPIRTENAIKKALTGAGTARAPKKRTMTGNLRNDINILAPGLYAEVARGGDGEGLAGFDMSLIAERLRDEGFMLPTVDTGKDSDAVIELVRQDIANGGGTLNERRTVEAMDEEAAKKRRAEILQLADEYGVVIRNGIIHRRIEDIEADVKAAIEADVGPAGERYATIRADLLDAGVDEGDLAKIEDPIADEYSGASSYEMSQMYRRLYNELKKEFGDALERREGRAQEGPGAVSSVHEGQAGSPRPALELAGQTESEARAEAERIAAAREAEEAEARGAEAKARKEQTDRDKADMQKRLENQPFEFGVGAKEAKKPQRDIFSSPVDAAAHEAATSPTNDKPAPTPGQMEAGNYAKGHIRLHGFDISIENPKGSERVAKDGSWRVPSMPAHYGYIKGTVGADKDHLDVFIGPNPESSTAWVINQVVADSSPAKFDEHKVMIGFDSADEAKKAYLDSFEKGYGARVFGSMTGALTIDELKAKIESGELSRKKFVGPVEGGTDAQREKQGYNEPAGPVAPIANETASSEAVSLSEVLKLAEGKTVSRQVVIAETGQTMTLNNQDAVATIKQINSDIQALEALRICIGG